MNNLNVGTSVKLNEEVFKYSWANRVSRENIYRVEDVDKADDTICIRDNNGTQFWVFASNCSPISIEPVEIDGVMYSYESGMITFVDNKWYLKTDPILVEINGRYVFKSSALVFEYEGKYYFKTEAILFKKKYYPTSSNQVVKYGDGYYHISTVVDAKSHNSKTIKVPVERTVTIGGIIYDISAVAEYGYRKAYETNDYVLESSLYQWDDGTYRLTRQGNLVYGYHSITRIWDAGDDAKFTIGFEIEKYKKPNFNFYREDLLDKKFIIEHDGSVPNGFELVTPTYDLFDKNLEKKLSYIKDFCDVPEVDNCGGHIHFGVSGFSGVETLKRLKGWLPLIYAMYRGRATNDYSFAKKTDKLISDGDRRQSVRLLSKHIEFRIVAAVYTYDTLIWRLGFMRILANNIDLNFEQVLLLALNKRSELSKHLLKTYKSKESMFKMLEAAVKFHTDLEGSDIKSVEKALKRMTTYKYKKSSSKVVIN